jgi:hypothetical protein
MSINNVLLVKEFESFDIALNNLVDRLNDMNIVERRWVQDGVRNYNKTITSFVKAINRGEKIVDSINGAIYLRDKHKSYEKHY